MLVPFRHQVRFLEHVGAVANLQLRHLLFVTQLEANLPEALHQILEIHEIFPVFFTNRHKLDINGNAHRGIVGHKLVRIIGLANRPDFGRPVHSHSGVTRLDALEHAKDGFAVKAAPDKVATNRHTVSHIGQKPVQDLLRGKEVVE